MSMPKVSFSDLEIAFDNFSYEHSYWLDKQTGAVVLIDGEIADLLREGEDLSDLPDWHREMAEEMRPLLLALGELPDQGADEVDLDRFVAIPKRESSEAYEDMVDFADTVTDAHLRDLLDVALRGKGAFRRFKDVLLGYPAERERWFRFEERRRREAIEAWAREEGVEISFEAGK